uniref:Methyltransferase NSUN6 n=1 Tax=Cacopsylla melanoneura TaxID=428564 RepID=A0A8D8Q7L6_9HEMI
MMLNRFHRLARKYFRTIMRYKIVNYFITLITMNFNVNSLPWVSKDSQHKSSVTNLTQDSEGHSSFVEKYANIYNTEQQQFLQYLASTPKFTTVRVNLKNYKPQNLVEIFRDQLIQRYGESSEVYVHPELPDCIVIGPLRKLSQLVVDHSYQIIVDQPCALAVLRGADVFAPGVLAMPVGIPKGSQVSVYGDLAHKCLRGSTVPYTQHKVLVATGVLKMDRYTLFVQSVTQPRGVAVEITSNLSGVPHVDVDPSMGLLQNLPSIAAGHYLDVQPGQKVLDMCSAPGNKLTHVAQLMDDTGILIALDKSKARVSRLNESLQSLGLSSVQTHQFDSTLIHASSEQDIDRMNLQQQSFDRILLDAPCSGFGQRPMFEDEIPRLDLNKKIRSHTFIQRKLLEAAIPLLKPNGILVYCTCSLSIDENEAMIAWLLKRHEEMELIPSLPRLGSHGLFHEDLKPEDRARMQRFGPTLSPNEGPNSDTIGFFLCKLRKNHHSHTTSKHGRQKERKIS